MRKTELKIKNLTLADESRHIRRIARKWPGEHPKRLSLHFHRISVVRPEARCGHLAYGFLRGRAYHQLEGTRRKEHAPNWDRVRDIVASFGVMDKRDAAQKLAEWRDAPLPDTVLEFRERQKANHAAARHAQREKDAVAYAEVRSAS